MGSIPLTALLPMHTSDPDARAQGTSLTNWTYVYLTCK